jgi:crotonobetainyl-CoA:carnitine CoA-transferase CaiB-like acyl-CoA transferase
MGRPELGTDPRFADQATRARHVEEIDAIVEAWSGSHDLEQIEAILDAEDVPASRIFTMEDIFASEHYRFRNMILDVADEDLGSVKLPGIVPKLSRTPGQVRWSGRRNGQDSHAILKEYLKLEDAEVERLLKAGAIGADALEAAE